MTTAKKPATARWCRALLAIACAALPLAVASPAHAAPPKLAGIEDFVDRIVKRQLSEGDIPGAAVTVVSGDATVMTRGYGVADVASRRPVDGADTGFYTASQAKLFTAAAALRLVRQGKLDLDADVNRYLRSVKVPEAYGKPVTLRDLLTYTSGFDNDVYGWSQWDAKHQPPLSGFVADHMPDRIRPPGQKVAYNNFDLVLAGYLIEVASGDSYQDYVRDHVFRPLGMNSTTAATPHPARLESKLAKPYRPDDDAGMVEEQGHLSPVAPCGGDTITTTADMSRFMKALLRHDPKLGDGVAEEMMDPQFAMDKRVPGMGYVFEQRPRNGNAIAYKDGDLPGVHTDMALLRDSHVGIYVTYTGDGNDNVGHWDGKDLINRIVDEYFPGKPDLPAETRTDPGAAEDVAGSYADNRTPRANFGKLATLTGAVTVEATGGGRLTTTGLSTDPTVDEQHWKPIASRMYREVDGQATIAFRGDGTLVSSQDPAGSWEPLAWYESPSLHLAIFALSALVLVVAGLGYPVAALVRRRQRHGAGARSATLLAWLAAATATGFLVLLAQLMTDMNALNAAMLTGDGLLSVALNLMSGFGVLAIAVAVAAALSWFRGWWTRTGRVMYSLVALSAIGFIAIAVVYRIIGVPFVITV